MLLMDFRVGCVLTIPGGGWSRGVQVEFQIMEYHSMDFVNLDTSTSLHNGTAFEWTSESMVSRLKTRSIRSELKSI